MNPLHHGEKAAAVTEFRVGNELNEGTHRLLL
jgi:hypothetical protein